jgi:hypothetical protein
MAFEDVLHRLWLTDMLPQWQHGFGQRYLPQRFPRESLHGHPP